MRSHPCRSDPEKDSGQDGDSERKEQNGPGRRRVDRHVVRRPAILEREIENQFACPYATPIPKIPPMMASRVDSTSALRTSRPREAPRATRRDVCERSLQSAGEHEIGEIAAGDKQHTCGRDEQQLSPSSYSIAWR